MAYLFEPDLEEFFDFSPFYGAESASAPIQPSEASTNAPDVNNLENQFSHEREQIDRSLFDNKVQFVGGIDREHAVAAPTLAAPNDANIIGPRLLQLPQVPVVPHHTNRMDRLLMLLPPAPPALYHANTIDPQLLRLPQVLAMPNKNADLRDSQLIPPPPIPQAPAGAFIDIGTPVFRFSMPPLHPIEHMNPQEPQNPVPREYVQKSDLDLLPHFDKLPLQLWYSHHFQTQWSSWTLQILHPVQETYIANNLTRDDPIILWGFYAKVPGTLMDPIRVANRTIELREMAKERCWSQEEIDIFTLGTMRGMLGAEVYTKLTMKWMDYPKTFEQVSQKYEKINATRAKIEAAVYAAW